jgi:hypothetical protein
VGGEYREAFTFDKQGSFLSITLGDVLLDHGAHLREGTLALVRKAREVFTHARRLVRHARSLAISAGDRELALTTKMSSIA